MELDAQPNQPVTIQQYVILAESQRQKAALQQQQTKYHELVAENRRLQEQHDAMQKENFEVTEYLRREILAKDEKAAAQEAKIEQLERKIADEAASAKQALQDQAVRLKQEADDRNRDQYNELVDVKEQLQVVLSFRAQQTKFQDEMERLKAENVRIQNEADDRLRAVEAANAQAAAKTRRDFDARLVEQQAANEEDLDERLSAATKRVLQHNRSLQQELRVHVEESEGLSRDLQQVVADRQRLAREVAIKAEMETQYAKRGTLQAREIREAGLKVAALERSLGQTLKDADAERQVLLQRTAAQLAQAEGEGNSLRRLVRVKARELANVRRLAHEVLLQRSDVETFLVSSIRQVRDQIMRERAEGRGEATPQPIPRPGQQVDIKDLQWEDRERVLRLLFAKINHQAKQSFYANLPAHSFKDFPGSDALHGTATKAGPAQLA